MATPAPPHTAPHAEASGGGSAGCLSRPAPSPLLLLLPVPEPVHNAGEVQTPRQRVQEHLVLLDALQELLQGQLPWRPERESRGGGVVSLAALHQGPELGSLGGQKATAGDAAVGGQAKEPESKVWSRNPSHPGLWLGPSTLGTPPRGTPALASSPSPLTSILENTVSVNSSALMVEPLQGLMARMAWGEEEVRGPLLTQPRWWGGCSGEWRQSWDSGA